MLTLAYKSWKTWESTLNYWTHLRRDKLFEDQKTGQTKYIRRITNYSLRWHFFDTVETKMWHWLLLRYSIIWRLRLRRRTPHVRWTHICQTILLTSVTMQVRHKKKYGKFNSKKPTTQLIEVLWKTYFADAFSKMPRKGSSYKKTKSTNYKGTKKN